MKTLVTSLTDMVGKTIASAKLVDCDEVVVIGFDDNSSAVMRASERYGCVEIEIVTEVGSTYDQYCCGFISQEEYDLEVSKRKAQMKDDNKARDLALLKTLKAKYE